MGTDTVISSHVTSETTLLDFLASYATANQIPYALWRLPEADEKYFLIARHTRNLSTDTIYEELPPGFVFAPFSKDREKLFLEGEHIFRFQQGHLQQDDDTISISSVAWLQEQLSSTKSKSVGRKYSPGTSIAEANACDYIKLVRQCINEIEKGSFEKIVPSRQHVINLPEEFDVLQSFEKLCGRYAHALISLVSIPGTGSWLTATPEVLVTVENRTTFKTVALAGTKKFEDGTQVKSVSWTQKEIEEQALVERYIISCFKKIRLREYDEHGPKTVVAGNLLHLKTDFSVDMIATGFPQLGTIMLQLLHPTSAVCGMPLDRSLEFLKQHEGYDRSFYSGYLGPVNVNQNIHIFVNLRCMQLLEEKGILYAGAGVTVDSIPESEFEETEMKFNTLRNVIL